MERMWIAGARGLRRTARRAVAALQIGAAACAATVAWGGEADVVVARASCSTERVCRFSVTVKHADIGTSHYADRYEIVGPDGAVIATRVLRHPHVHEQPFTRILSGVELPDGVDRVTVRAHDSVHAFGGHEVEVVIRIGEPEPAEDEDA